MLRKRKGRMGATNERTHAHAGNAHSLLECVHAYMRDCVLYDPCFLGCFFVCLFLRVCVSSFACLLLFVSVFVCLCVCVRICLPACLPAHSLECWIACLHTCFCACLRAFVCLCVGCLACLDSLVLIGAHLGLVYFFLYHSVRRGDVLGANICQSGAHAPTRPIGEMSSYNCQSSRFSYCCMSMCHPVMENDEITINKTQSNNNKQKYNKIQYSTINK